MPVYFLMPTDGGPIKIGFSDDVAARHRQLESHYGRPLVLLAIMPGGREEEAAIHARFGHLRLRRHGHHGRVVEQFRPAPELMQFINRPLLVHPDPHAVEVMIPSRRYNTPLVRLDDDVVEKAKKVAALKGMSLAKYFSDILRPAVDRDFAKEIRKLSREGGEA